MGKLLNEDRQQGIGSYLREKWHYGNYPKKDDDICDLKSGAFA